jgi:DUF1365 family protein
MVDLIFMIIRQNAANQCVAHALASRCARAIDIKTSQADDHVPYLKASLSGNRRDATAEAVARLCHLINRDIYCPPSLLAVLWECVLDLGNLLSDGRF